MTKPVSLEGQRATIDEADVTPTFQVSLQGVTQTIYAAVVMVSSGIRFSGFTVTHAQGEGILAAGHGRDISGISISHSAIVHNDLGFGVNNSPYATDCGITVPGHNPGALNKMSQPQPSVAGVYDNVIRNNVVTNNGVKGEGAGVLFANGARRRARRTTDRHRMAAHRARPHRPAQQL